MTAIQGHFSFPGHWDWMLTADLKMMKGEDGVTTSPSTCSLCTPTHLGPTCEVVMVTTLTMLWASSHDRGSLGGQWVPCLALTMDYLIFAASQCQYCRYLPEMGPLKCIMFSPLNQNMSRCETMQVWIGSKPQPIVYVFQNIMLCVMTCTTFVYKNKL